MPVSSAALMEVHALPAYSISILEFVRPTSAAENTKVKVAPDRLKEERAGPVLSVTYEQSAAEEH